MDARRKEIEHLDGEVRRLEHQITAECVEIGRRIAGLDHSGVRNEELRKYLNSVETLKRSTESSRADIDRIRGLTRQIETRAQEIDENNRRREQLQRERHSRFVELGAGTYTVYKALADRDPWRATFEEVIKLDLEIDRRHEELKALEADEATKGFFKSLALKPRKMSLRGDISRLDREKTVAYEQAGAKIAETEFLRLTEGPLRQLFEAVQERGRTIESLGAQNDRKVDEIERCRADLKRLEADDRAGEKIKEIEKRIEGMQKELDVMHCWTGQLYLERDLRGEVQDGNLSAKYEIVAGLRESIRKKSQQIDRLKAETEIEEITRKERERRARRKQLEEDMRVKERQIGVIDIEINMGLRRLEELKRVMTGEAPYTDAPPLPPTPDLYHPPPVGDGDRNQRV
ncbi:MAG TPA: hypothetical protein VJB14_12570 [Planctomycetota bacterium]|nr:hypothetical protein [Planctomycetota bacterium]